MENDYSGDCQHFDGCTDGNGNNQLPGTRAVLKRKTDGTADKGKLTGHSDNGKRTERLKTKMTWSAAPRHSILNNQLIYAAREP